MVRREEACRSCGSTALRPVLDLGETPLADRLLREEQLRLPEPRYRLLVSFCEDCTLVQIRDTVPPEELFCQDYPYYSSFSDALLHHSREHALEEIDDLGLDPGSLVVEIASNDGYLLRNFAERGVPVLGIDPASGPAAAAREQGIETLETFFTRELAERLAGEGRRADLLIAKNVLAHVPDLDGFVAGIATLLRDEGVAALEFPYLRDLVEHCEFDTIYHEHLCYFSVHALTALFERHGLTLFRLRRLSIHGGSLRIWVKRGAEREASVEEALAQERDLGMTSWEFFRDFGRRVESIRDQLRTLLSGLKAEGARIAAYGAAAKGSTLLNYTEIGRETLDFVVDRNVHKQGRFMPGVHLPIRPVEELVAAQPDYALILAWNFREEIVAQQHEYVRRGGRFLVPIPRPVIVGS